MIAHGGKPAGGLWAKLTGQLKLRPPTAGILLRLFATRRPRSAFEAGDPLLAAQNAALGADVNN